MNNKLPPIANVDPITGQRLVVSFVEQPACTHPSAEELLAYWKACKSRGDFVMGRDVPARPIAALMKHLNVVEPTDDGANFRFRLVGSILQQRFAHNVSGLSLSEVYDEDAAKTLEAFLRKAIFTQAPVFLMVKVKGLLGDVFRPQTILLPMKAPDERTSWVLCGLFYSEPTGQQEN